MDIESILARIKLFTQGEKKKEKKNPELGEGGDLRRLFLKSKITTKDMQCGFVYMYAST